MENRLSGKKILIIKGSLLSDVELRDALVRLGAKVTVTNTVTMAFELVGRKRFDGAVVDHGLHNEAFDLCTDLQALDIPYISANAPHRLQGLDARERTADAMAQRLANLMDLGDADVSADDFADYMPIDELPPEMRAL